MSLTSRVDKETACAVKIAGYPMTVYGGVVTASFARELELDARAWEEVAHKLAQRLRSIPESGAVRFPDARDREALQAYNNQLALKR